MATAPHCQQEEGSSSAASSSDATFIRYPSGARHRVVQEGTGRTPTLNDTVKIDWVVWCDAFVGQDTALDFLGAVFSVSDLNEWEREALMSMREGEVRQIKVPDLYDPPYVQLRLISIE
mmetsp:Transcript_17933/g.43124  ORF Transcript_17933/g.43124 Transcript_17933/m.43124 type:complete len:119 (-) Transcript_17933:525-881(-)